MKYFIYLVVSILISSIGIHVYSYELSEYDKQFLIQFESKIAQVGRDGGKERLLRVGTELEQLSHSLAHDERSLALLGGILELISVHATEQFGVGVTRDLAAHNPNQMNRKENPSETISATPGASSSTTTTETVSTDPEITVSEVPSSSERMTLVDFYTTYQDYLTNQTPFPQSCILYYDKIDEIAKRRNFPTSLIIAMWYREHTCHFSNPANGRGNFQITSHYYEPGAISWEEFAQQVENFIDFSYGKWEWYDSLQKFDEIPVTLTYEHADLLSVRKHAILYNGLYSGTTPENSTYTNQNFGRPSDGRDGIVAMMLKVIGREMENNYR